MDKEAYVMDKEAYKIHIFLALSLIIAIFIRLYPLKNYAVWGSDSGEYYFLSNYLYECGNLSLEYGGWGRTYPYFPGMFIVVAWAARLFGVSILSSLRFSVPILSSLSVVLLYFIAMEIFKDKKVALLSSLFLAVFVAHVYSTSKPTPGSLADPLLLGCILLLLKSYKSKSYLPFLYLTTIALVITHHMSTYFLIISLLGGIFIRELSHKAYSKKLKVELPYALFLLSSTFIFWYGFTNFPKHILSSAIPFIPSWGYIPLAYLGLIFLAMLIYGFKGKLFAHLTYPSAKKLLKRYLMILMIFTMIALIIVVTTVPGTSIQVGTDALIWALPAIIFTSFYIMGTGIVHTYENGGFVYGWILALLLSFLVGAVMHSHTLIPYRHLQYIAPPLVLLSSLGIVKLHGILPTKRKKRGLKIFVSVLVVAMAFTAYPPPGVFGGFDEGLTSGDMEAVEWISCNIPENAVIATDHRLSSAIFGFAGVMCTWDSASQILYGESYEEARDQLISCETPAGNRSIDYVVIDKTMVEKGVALLQWKNALHLSEGAVKKFYRHPFELIYDNGDVQIFRVRIPRV